MAALITLFVLALGALATWLIWRPDAQRARLTRWRQRLDGDPTLQEWVGTVAVAEPAASYFGSEPVAFTACYTAHRGWKPDHDLVRTIDQMTVYSRQTRAVPFELIGDDGSRIRVTLDDTSLVHVATTWLGEGVSSADAEPLPRGKYGAVLAGYWEMAIRPGERIKVLGVANASVRGGGAYREAPAARITVDSECLVCAPELDRPALLARSVPPLTGGLLRLLGTAFVVVMVVAALLAAVRF